MAHFAHIDENNIVTQVISIHNDYEVNGQDYINNILGLSGTWIQTSYSARRGIKHIQVPTMRTGPRGAQVINWQLSATSLSGLRYNYAGIGYTYDPIKDSFIPPKPIAYPSWVLNETTQNWEAPVPRPLDSGYYGGNKLYTWDESSLSWICVGNNTYTTIVSGW
jgi:hypothetical protein